MSDSWGIAWFFGTKHDSVLDAFEEKRKAPCPPGGARGVVQGARRISQSSHWFGRTEDGLRLTVAETKRNMFLGVKALHHLLVLCALYGMSPE